jgi:hypothetical protein
MRILNIYFQAGHPAVVAVGANIAGNKGTHDMMPCVDNLPIIAPNAHGRDSIANYSEMLL